MTPLVACRDGIRRVNGAPAILIGMWMMSVLVSLPLALALRGMLDEHLGDSLAADAAAGGVNYDWMQEFGDQATGLGVTFTPAVIGFGAVVDNLSAFIDNDRRPVIIGGAASAYVALWTFFAGGIIDRYGRDRATRAHGFLAASGVFFFRFLRLGVVMWIAYAFLFGFMHPWLFAKLYPQIIHDVTVERTAFLARVGLYVVFGFVLAACNLVFDYAKVRAVVEDRRSALGAVWAGARFVQRNYAATVALYLVDVALFLLVLAIYAVLAPGVSSGGRPMWIGFLVSQAYVLARVWVKLVFWASETALFQGRLAHAGYVTTPKSQWPDSPMAEAIRN